MIAAGQNYLIGLCGNFCKSRVYLYLDGTKETGMEIKEQKKERDVMAMISCRNCGGQVSDKAKQCVHCGAVLIPEQKKNCMECGAELDASAAICPNCGCPVEDMDSILSNKETPQKVRVKVTKKVKILIGVSVALMLVIAAIIVCVCRYQKKKEKDNYEQRIEEYSDNLESAVYSMLSGASDAETCGNLIKKVWYNAIYEETDTETDKYTRPKGYFVSDFNEALKNLFSDTKFNRQIDEIEDNQKTVNSLMKKLKNPPEEYEEAYEAVYQLYNAYLSFTNLVIEPSGSLQSFSNKFSDEDKETLNCYNTMKLYLDE